MWWGGDDDSEDEGKGRAAGTGGVEFLYPDALSDAEDGPTGLFEAEAELAEFSRIEVDEDLYTNVVLSMLSPTDNFTTRAFSVSLIILVACLQLVLAIAILSHVHAAMSWTSMSVKQKSMRELYANLLNEGRLEYIRMEKHDVNEVCGDFDYDLEERGLAGTNWTAYYEFKKVPVNNWHPWEIPPTDRSELDTARFVLENTEYMCVYVIVTFMWSLTTINGMRLIVQLCLAVVQMPLARHPDEKLLSQDEDEFEILAFTKMAKFTGLVCVLYRIFISLFIFVVGCQFLMWTSTNIELILNALALTFILELDRITFKAAISRSRQNLISQIKNLRWRDPTNFSRRFMRFSKVSLMLIVLGASALGTTVLRKIQHDAYMDMFTLAASICLFQGPTPGYWNQFRATFPAPGLCETVLGLKCEAPVVGEKGVPCVEDWNQKLCKFYLKTDSVFSTWSNIDWQVQGACVAFVEGHGPYAVPDLRFPDPPATTFDFLASTCQVMWQKHPRVLFRGAERESTGPRVRVYPYKDWIPAAPFWCRYRQGSEVVLTEGQPVPPGAWRENLLNCSGSKLAYADPKHTAAIMMAQGTEDAADDAAGVDNITEADGPFSGIWLSPKMGCVIIENKGSEAQVTNSFLPFSPVGATVQGNRLKLRQEPFYTGELKDDGKIYLSNGAVLVNQKTEIEKTKRAQEEQQKKKRAFVLFFR